MCFEAWCEFIEGAFQEKGEGSCVSKAPERGWGGYPREQQRWEGQVCRLAPELSQSSLGEVNQMPLRLVNRCQQREIGQWIICGPVCVQATNC